MLNENNVFAFLNFILYYRIMIRKITSLVVLCCLLVISAVAQKKRKPELLVYGNSIEAAVMALQSAQSEVPTLWVRHKAFLEGYSGQNLALSANSAKLSSGIFAQILCSALKQTKVTDSILVKSAADLPIQKIVDFVEGRAKELPQLTIIDNIDVKQLSGQDDKWKVVLNNNVIYNLRSVIDASYEQRLTKQLSSTVQGAPVGDSLDSLTDNSLKTLLASGMFDSKMSFTTLQNILPKQGANQFFAFAPPFDLMKSKDNLPYSVARAQAIAAVAAYMSFFKVSFDKIAVRKVQEELMNFGLATFALQDIQSQEANFWYIQRVLLSGLLKPKLSEESLLFQPNDTLDFQSIKSNILASSTRSQIWFAEHDLHTLTLKDGISLARFIGQRGSEMDNQVSQIWHKRFGKTYPYDMNRVLTRVEFALLMDVFVNPFGLRIDNKGELVQ